MPPQPGAMRSRWTAYAALSTTLAAGVIVKSLAQRPNFYSATVYLSQSSANLMILCNMVFVAACSFLILLQKILYGPLRPIEIEQLYEKAWFAVTETCLAMTIFRGEIGAWFLVMFFSLLAGKVWGWIGEGRVEVLEQQQHNILAGRSARLFHTRLALSLALSVLFDMTMLDYVVSQVLHMARPDMMVMFGFEFAVLTVTSLSTATRYALNLIEIGIVRGQKQKRMDVMRKERVDAAVREVQEQENQRSNGVAAQSTDAQPAVEGDFERRRAQAVAAAAAVPIDEADVEVEGWEGKGRWVFYLDLTTDFCKLVIYLSFFFILLIFYGLPLHIMRDVFLTCRSFIKRIGDFMRYRTATRDMNERYPDATEAEIGENECIICREEMRPYVPPAAGAATDPVMERMRPKKLPCGHVLHFACLRSWLERQQICPTCRATVVPNAPPAQGQAAAAPGVAPRAQHPQNAANGRPRVFQLGPLRIGVGAGRGNNMLEELQEQLVNLNPPPIPPQNGNAPQQYGFGIRWDGIRRRAQGGNNRPPRGSVQDHLDSVERQIQRELDSLQASMGEVQALRNIQGQLARIRLARQGPTAPLQQPTASQGATSIPRPMTGPAMTGLVGQPQQGILQSGSDQLPEGLTLPEGWTMMPLQPMQAQQFPPPMMFPPPGVQPNIPAMPHLPQMPTLAHPEPPAQPPQETDPTLANILRETQEAVRATTTQLDGSNEAGSQQTPGQNPLAETIRLEGEVAQSRERMAELTSQLRGMAQNIPGMLPNNETTSPRAAPAIARSQPLSRESHSRGQVSSPPSMIQQNRSVQPQNRPLQPREQNHSSTSSSQSQSPQPQSRTSAIQQRSPQASRAAPSGSMNSTGSSRSTTAASVKPPQQLTPTSRVSSSTSTDTRSRSPHRPTRSIGSSWGFSGVEANKEKDEDDEDDDDEDDTTDSDDDSDEATHDTKRTNGTSGQQNRENGAKSTVDSRSRGTKGKNPTVEELVEDPD